MSVDAPITVDDFTKVHGKEAQIARWFSRAGIPVHLRNPDVHAKTDGNTSDADLLGITYDFKRIGSSNVSKIVKEVTGKLGRQGPGFAIDLSISGVDGDAALHRLAILLDDPQISEFIVVRDGNAVRIKK